jgi:hypothetical protein
MTVKPAFLFSLPRSGSTLLQRLVATHSKVATTSEPWIMLPLLYTMRVQGVSTEYDQRHAVRALHDFAENIPGGFDTYRREIRRLALGLYSKAAGSGASWFLDKTPRYYFIARELIDLFPEARFILLTRNPLAIAASVVSEFGQGAWVIPKWEHYLKTAIDRLFVPEIMSRCLIVSYEELVADPDDTTARIHRHLDLEPVANPAAHFGEVVLTGEHGDHSEHPGVRNTNPYAWVDVYSNPVRRRWGERFVDRVGRDKLSLMGYEKSVLMDALDRAPRSFSGMGEDTARIAIWRARRMYVRRSWADPLYLSGTVGLLSP